MTAKQKAWLDSNPDYRPLGIGGAQVGSASGSGATDFRFRKRGTLHPAGRFEPATRANPVSNAGGAFGVTTIPLPSLTRESNKL